MRRRFHTFKIGSEVVLAAIGEATPDGMSKVQVLLPSYTILEAADASINSDRMQVRSVGQKQRTWVLAKTPIRCHAHEQMERHNVWNAWYANTSTPYAIRSDLHATDGATRAWRQLDAESGADPSCTVWARCCQDYTEAELDRIQQAILQVSHLHYSHGS